MKTDFVVDKSLENPSNTFLTLNDMRILINKNSPEYYAYCKNKIVTESWKFLHELYSLAGIEFENAISLENLDELKKIYITFIKVEADVKTFSNKINIKGALRTQLETLFETPIKLDSVNPVMDVMRKIRNEVERDLLDATYNYWKYRNITAISVKNFTSTQNNLFSAPAPLLKKKKSARCALM